jgi:hypothetical protein
LLSSGSYDPDILEDVEKSRGEREEGLGGFPPYLDII